MQMPSWELLSKGSDKLCWAVCAGGLEPASLPKASWGKHGEVSGPPVSYTVLHSEAAKAESLQVFSSILHKSAEIVKNTK